MNRVGHMLQEKLETRERLEIDSFLCLIETRVNREPTLAA
jgi:hypothetical protein